MCCMTPLACEFVSEHAPTGRACTGNIHACKRIPISRFTNISIPVLVNSQHALQLNKQSCIDHLSGGIAVFYCSVCTLLCLHFAVFAMLSSHCCVCIAVLKPGMTTSLMHCRICLTQPCQGPSLFQPHRPCRTSGKGGSTRAGRAAGVA